VALTPQGEPEPATGLPGGPPPPEGSRNSRILAPLRTEGARGVAVAVGSTVVFITVLVVVVVNSSGWPQIREAFFDGEIFAEAFPKILVKFWRNVFIFTVAEVFVLIFAMVIAVMRSLSGPVFTPLRVLAAGYTDLFRAVPTILVIALLGFGAPALQIKGVPRSDVFWAIVALVYVVITIPQARFVDWLVARDRRRRQAGAAL